jgi:hypothetical protein
MDNQSSKQSDTAPKAAVRREENPSGGFWDHQVPRYGWIHTSDRKSPKYKPELLLVFVHGIMGSALGTWGELPEQILAGADMDADAFTFEYAAGPLHRCSIETASEDLHTALRILYPTVDGERASTIADSGWRNIIFITHSLGGLVSRYMLWQEAKAIAGLPNADDSVFTDALWPRTRAMVNVAVPHRGGHVLLTVPLFALYHLFFAVAAPLLFLARLVQLDVDFGYQSFVYQLLYRNCFLRRLNEGYLQCDQALLSRTLPCPGRLEISARGDGAVASRTFHTDRLIDHVRLKGNHSTVKGALTSDRETGIGLQRIKKLVEHYCGTEYLIAQRSHIRTIGLDRQAGVGALLVETGCATAGFSQQDVHDRLVTALTSPMTVQGALLVMGDAGVGKTTVLRKVTKTLSVRLLNDAACTSPLAVLYALQQVKLDSADLAELNAVAAKEDPKLLLRIILRRWAAWVSNELAFPGAVPPEWLCDKLVSHRGARQMIVLLDGLDEFLLNNPHVEISRFQILFRACQSASHFRLVGGIRSSHRAANVLKNEAGSTFLIGQLTAEEAARVFPQLKGVLRDLQQRGDMDEDVWRLLLSILILKNIATIENLSTDMLSSRTRVVATALQGLIRGSELTLSMPDTNEQQWNYILAFIGWAAYRSQGVHYDVKELREETLAIVRNWTNCYEPDLAAALQLLENEEVFERAMAKTVFYATGPTRVRFQHLEWSNHLAARYAAVAWENHHFAELVPIVCTLPIVKAAAELLIESRVTVALAKMVLAAARPQIVEYLRSNFYAIVCNGVMPVDAQALQFLIRDLPEAGPISRIVFFNGFGVRTLMSRQEGRDESGEDIRREFFELARRTVEDFRQRWQQNGEWHLQPGLPEAVVASTAWNYLDAFHRIFGIAAPSADAWPCLGAANGALAAQEAEALPVISTGGPAPEAREEHEAVQASWITLVEYMPRDLNRLINGLHYAFFLLVAKKYRVHVTQVNQVLRGLFLDQAVRDLFYSYDEAPRLREVYDNLRGIYLDTIGGANDFSIDQDEDDADTRLNLNPKSVKVAENGSR